MFDNTRLRRNRRNDALRAMVRETRVCADDLILPLFIEEEIEKPIAIPTMPDVSRLPEKMLAQHIKSIAADGLRAVLLFGVSHHKDATGSDSWHDSGLLTRMVKRAKNAAPEMMVIADCCFCEYTDHGHCGVIDGDTVHNDLTIGNLARQAVAAARAGADIIAPSAMMDHQVTAIRRALDEAGFVDIPIMSYSSKFASSFYGPFRVAADCKLRGNRKTYQLDPANGREALRESILDEHEGADMLIVKPAVAYLDVLAKLRQQSLLPLAAYQVSGEYAMLKYAALAGAIDEKRAVSETLTAIKRAGADMIISYYARHVIRENWLNV